MSYSGGIADKSGNIYEAKWAVRQLLHVIRGEAEAIRFESISHEDQGFEFHIEVEGATEHHQAKRQTLNGNWTLRRLEREGVLDSFKAKLAAPHSDRCVFISQSPAPQLHGLIEKASTAQSGRELQESIGVQDVGNLAEICSIWSIDTEVAFQWLRRVEVRVLPEKEIDGLIDSYVRLVFREDPEAAFPVLRAFLEGRMNRPITTDNVRRELREGGTLSFKDWALDTTLAEQLERTTDEYISSYGAYGFSTIVLPRVEAHQAAEFLTSGSANRLVILTGSAGAGKSGAVRELINRLRGSSIPCLAFRIDRMLEGGGPTNSEDLGQQITGRRESPVISLAGKFPTATTVLLIDQVEAVSDLSGRGQRLKDIVLNLIDQAMRFPNVHIALVCREFDFVNDPRLKALQEQDSVHRISVQLLDWDNEVTKVLREIGVDPSLLQRSQRELLRLPLNLAVFATLDPENRNSTFESTADLFEKLISQKEQALAAGGHVFSIWHALGRMAERMSDEQTLSCPASVLDKIPRSADLLASEGLAILTRPTIAFFHETLFDHSYARSFVGGNDSIIRLLKSAEQTLFRRTQIRQILAAYRQINLAGSYLKQLREVLSTEGIRYQIREAVARWLGSLDEPTGAEARVVLSLDRGGGPVPNLVSQATVSAGWFRIFATEGVIDRWLDSDDPLRRNQALWRLRAAPDSAGDEVARILRRWWQRDPERSAELLAFFQYLDKPRNAALVQLLVDVIRSAPGVLFGSDNGHAEVGGLFILKTKQDTKASGAALKAWLETWFEQNNVGYPFEDGRINRNEFYWVRELAKGDPASFLDAVIPAYRETIARAALDPKMSSRPFNHPFARCFKGADTGADGLFALILSAFRELALTDPETTRRLLEGIDPLAHPSALHIHLEAISGNGEALHDLLPHLLLLDGLFDAGWSGAKYMPFAEAAKAAVAFFSPADREILEQRILTYHPELREAQRYARLAKEQANNQRENSKSAIRTLMFAGEAQRAVLETIGPAHLPDLSRWRLIELGHKFNGRALPQPHAITSGWIPPPIPKERAVLMSDGQWLSAMSRYSDGMDMVRVRHGGAEALAAVLTEIVKEKEERFAALLLKIPLDTNPTYPRAIIFGLSSGEPCSEGLARAIAFAHNWPGRPFGREIAYCFQHHPSVAAQTGMLDILVWYVENAPSEVDPEEDEQQVHRERLYLEALLSDRGIIVSSTHSARATAAEALGSVLWERPELVPTIVPVIESRIRLEQLRSVRVALLHAIVPLLRHAPTEAARLTESIVDRHPNDLSELLTHQGVRLIFYLFRSAPTVATPLMERMLASEDETARLIGTFHLIREGFYDECLGRRVDALVSVHGPARTIAAKLAALHLPLAEYADRARSMLVNSFNDEEERVRSEACNGSGCLDSFRGGIS